MGFKDLLLLASLLCSPLLSAQELATGVQASQQPSIFPALSEAVITNSLDGKGLDGKDKSPYHLKLAVKQWTYQPFLQNGNPVEVSTTITVNFSLNGSTVERF